MYGRANLYSKLNLFTSVDKIETFQFCDKIEFCSMKSNFVPHDSSLWKKIHFC